VVLKRGYTHIDNWAAENLLLVIRHEIDQGLAMTTIFGGYVIHGDRRVQLDVVQNPDARSIENTLCLLAENKGLLKMELNPAPKTGPFELVLYAEAGNFFFMLNEIDDDGDVTVRILVKNGLEDDAISLLGDEYPASTTTRSQQLVNDTFLEFAKTGNVSSNILK
jgi:hypothetical protein